VGQGQEGRHGKSRVAASNRCILIGRWPPAGRRCRWIARHSGCGGPPPSSEASSLTRRAQTNRETVIIWGRQVVRSRRTADKGPLCQFAAQSRSDFLCDDSISFVPLRLSPSNSAVSTLVTALDVPSLALDNRSEFVAAPFGRGLNRRTAWSSGRQTSWRRHHGLERPSARRMGGVSSAVRTHLGEGPAGRQSGRPGMGLGRLFADRASRSARQPGHSG